MQIRPHSSLVAVVRGTLPISSPGNSQLVRHLNPPPPVFQSVKFSALTRCNVDHNAIPIQNEDIFYRRCLTDYIYLLIHTLTIYVTIIYFNLLLTYRGRKNQLLTEQRNLSWKCPDSLFTSYSNCLFHFTGFTEYCLRNLIFSSEISQVTTEKIFSHLQLRKQLRKIWIKIMFVYTELFSFAHCQFYSLKRLSEGRNIIW